MRLNIVIDVQSRVSVRILLQIKIYLLTTMPQKGSVKGVCSTRSQSSVIPVSMSF